MLGLFLYLGMGYSVLNTGLNVLGNVTVKEYIEPTLYNVLRKEAETNGLSSEKQLDSDFIALCKMKVTKKGTIIALKKLCDYTIASNYGEVLQNPFASKKVLTKSSN